MKYYDDNYERIFNEKEEQTFFDSVEAHERHLDRIYVMPRDVHIGEITNVKISMEKDENGDEVIGSCEARVVCMPEDYYDMANIDATTENKDTDTVSETDSEKTDEESGTESSDNISEETNEADTEESNEVPVAAPEPQRVYINVMTVNVNPKDAEAWLDTFENGTKLCLVSPKIIAPISDNVKTSVINRTTMNYKGSIVQQTHLLNVSPLCLGAVMTDLIKAHNKYSLQLIVDGGKVQSILTKRYISSDQRTTFNEADKILKKGDVVGEFAGGYLSHTWTSAYYKVASEGKEIEATVRISDSSTGDGSIAICPRITTINGEKKSNIVFEDSWTQIHAKFELEELRLGLQASIQQAKNNAELLAGTMMQLIKHPTDYTQRVIEQLNKLAKKQATTPISKENEEKIKAEVAAFAAFQNLTVWDFISILWDIPQQSKLSTQTSRDSLQRTVSRILLINHDEMDKIIIKKK